MALKDWKKLMDTDFRKSYLHRKKNIKLVLAPIDARFFVATTTNPSKPFLSKRYKSKTYASKKAKEYMRSH
jgi:hypothetical protein